MVVEGDSTGAQPLLVVMLGATASGKTSLAIELAQRFRGEIVSCDSVAVYRDFEIGTAKPSPDQRNLIPHHMIDIVFPDQPYTAGDYSRDGRRALSDISARGKLPIVAGGTGLYLRALLEGLFPGPRRHEPLRSRLRDMAQTHGSAHIAKILCRIDPASAERIHPNDTPKLIRAIEVTLAARQPMSQAWKSGRDSLHGFRILRIGLDPPRTALYARIDHRAEAMFTNGLLNETENLISRYCADCRPLGSLGYKQAAMILRGELSLHVGIAATKQAHRNYAKRQMTWFHREPNVHWLRGFGDDPEIAAHAVAHIDANFSPDQ